MAGTFTLKFLAEGQLPNAEAALYTVPALTTALLKKLILVNTSAGAIAVDILVRKAAGASRRIIDKGYSIPANESRVIDVDNIVLETTDTIRGFAGTAAVIDYSLSGVLET